MYKNIVVIILFLVSASSVYALQSSTSRNQLTKEEQDQYDSLVAKARLAEQFGYRDKAIQLYEEAVNIKPSDYELHYRIGFLYKKDNKYDQALIKFKQAIKAEPGFAEAHYSLCSVYNKKQDHEKAVSACSTAIRLKPGYARAFNGRASAYRKLGKLDMAISDYSKAIELRPDIAQLYSNRGLAYGVANQLELAMKDFNTALELKPDNYKATVGRGKVYFMLQKFQLAIDDYNKTIEIKPDHPSAYNNLAWVYATAKDPSYQNGKKAVELAKKACELSHWEKLNYLDTLAAAYARAGDFNEAVRLQNRILSDKRLPEEKKTSYRQRLELYKTRKAYIADK